MTSPKLAVTLCGATASENALGCLAASSTFLAAGVSALEAAQAFTAVEEAGLDGRIQTLAPEQRRLAVVWVEAQRSAYAKIMQARGKSADGPLPAGFSMHLVYRAEGPSDAQPA